MAPNTAPVKKVEGTKAKNMQKPPLFYPSVFRYKCRGALHLTSDEQGSAGVCRGIQSRLEHVKDLAGRSTYPQAVKAFEEAANFKQGMTSEEESSIQHDSLRDLLQTQAMIYHEHPKEKEGGSNTKEDEGPWHDWSCYGTTEVHLLVLRDVKSDKETVAGVSPDCRFGVSMRDVGTNKGGDTVATARIGPLEISLGNHYEFPEQDGVTARKEEVMRRRTTRQGPPHETPPERKKTQPKEDETDMVRKMWETMGKVAESMKINAIILKESTQDDFPSRFLDASQRVAGQLGSTVVRTGSLMGSVYKMWRDGLDDDDDDLDD